MSARAYLSLLLGTVVAAAHAQVPRADGAVTYSRICQGCHMPDGRGAEGAGRYPALAGNERLAAATYPVLVVLQGRHGMPPFGDWLDDAQVAGVVNHVRTHFGNAWRDAVTPDDVRRMRASLATETPDPTGSTMPSLRDRIAAASGGLLVAAATAAPAADVVRHRIPNSDFPILQAVEVPPGYKTIYLSGVVPSATDTTKPGNSLEAFGDTRAQTVSVLQNIERNLKRLDLSMADVIKMQVFLVGDPRLGGKMDFAGLMAGYTQFFGTKDQPNLPTRSVFQVAGLANPGWLVEIEVVAVAKP